MINQIITILYKFRRPLTSKRRFGKISKFETKMLGMIEKMIDKFEIMERDRGKL